MVAVSKRSMQVLQIATPCCSEIEWDLDEGILITEIDTRGSRLRRRYCGSSDKYQLFDEDEDAK
jgi:hypothetical protein